MNFEPNGNTSADGEPPQRKRRRGRRGGQRHRRRREAREARAGSEPAGIAPERTSDDAEILENDDSQPEPGNELNPPATNAPADGARRGQGSRSDRGGRRRVGRGGRGRSSDRQRDRDRPAPAPVEMMDDLDETAELDERAAAEEIDADELLDAATPAVAADDDGFDDIVDDEPEERGPAIVVESSDDPRRDAIPGKQEMLINFADQDECRIAIVSNGRLDELYMERAASVSHVGNIYKGRVTNVEPSIQAAFVDFGLPIHGFLHISDLHPQYFPDSRDGEQVGRKTPRRERPPIQRCLRRGQEVIVQITKEGIGTKGPTMTTYVSLPGRFLVMMPGMAQLGVSRKIEDDETRRTARDLLNQLRLPKDMGFIMRTAGMDRTRRELQHDLNYLARLWRVVQKRITTQRAPCELYQESDLVIRTVRDVYNDDIGRIVVDDERTAKKVAEFLSIANPRGSDRVVRFTGVDPLFHLYSIEQEIEKLHSRHVPLPCGGSLVIDPTEALVAIDVNSGRFRVPNDAEMTALRVNLEAAEEIARQLRLRDLGGVIICDFIDMRLEKHRREVERKIRDALKGHKERAKILRMSQFGIIEMTRQRHGPSISRSVYMDCPHCSGSGLVKSVESMTLDVLRVIQLAVHRENVNLIDVRVSAPVASFLLNRKRHVLSRLEGATGRTITISAVANYGPDQVTYSCLDRRGREIPLNTIAPVRLPAPGPQPHPHPETESGRPRSQPARGDVERAAPPSRGEAASDRGPRRDDRRGRGGRGGRGAGRDGERGRGRGQDRVEEPREDRYTRAVSAPREEESPRPPSPMMPITPAPRYEPPAAIPPRAPLPVTPAARAGGFNAGIEIGDPAPARRSVAAESTPQVTRIPARTIIPPSTARRDTAASRSMQARPSGGFADAIFDGSSDSASRANDRGGSHTESMGGYAEESAIGAEAPADESGVPSAPAGRRKPRAAKPRAATTRKTASETVKKPASPRRKKSS